MNAEVKLTTEQRHFAEIVINGTSKGKREINGTPSLREFASGLAREFGVRTFNVTVDNQPLTASKADEPVRAGSTVAVQAKDARGLSLAAAA